MSPWTDERVAKLRRGFAEGLSFSEIATLIGGVSRCAVIGKADRIGLRGRTQGRPPIVAAPKPRISGGSAAKNFRTVPLPAPVASTNEPDARGKLRDICDDGLCHYPHGDIRADWRYCAWPTPSIMDPYCPYHRAKIYQPMRQREAKSGVEVDAA